MANDPIRIGIVGAGANTKLRHIPGFQAIDGVEVVSVCNRSRESGRTVADQFNIPTVYDHWQELLEDESLNAVCIGTWPYMHRTLVLAALENDKHVVTEARMAMNAKEAQEMLASYQRKQREAEAEADAIVAQAKTEAKALKAEARTTSPCSAAVD